MTLDDIDSVEKALSLQLPAEYKQFITNYPRRLANTEAPDYACLDDAAVLISENQAVRGGHFYGQEWPKDLFLIGTNGCGDSYAIDMTVSPVAVQFFDHERLEFVPFAPSLDSFVANLVAEYTEG